MRKGLDGFSEGCSRDRRGTRPLFTSILGSVECFTDVPDACRPKLKRLSRVECFIQAGAIIR